MNAVAATKPRYRVPCVEVDSEVRLDEFDNDDIAEHRAVAGTYAAPDMYPQSLASAKRCDEIARRMGALLPQPLSAPAVRVHAETSLVLERYPRELSGIRSSQALIVEMDAYEPMPLHEHVLVWLGIVITAGLLVMLTVERIAS